MPEQQTAAQLVKMMGDADPETARAGKRQLWERVHREGPKRKGLPGRLVSELEKDQPAQVRRELLWMISELGSDAAVEPVAKLLGNPELREDARAALERIPGDKSLAALKAGLEQAPPAFKPAMAQSLRRRGVAVEGLPTGKLNPERKTQVAPVGREEAKS